MKTTNILIKLLLLFFVLGGVNAWAQDTKTITLTFSNISETSATVNVSGTGAEGVTATVGRARQKDSTDKDFFTRGAGFRDNILGIEYSNEKNNYWEVPITINGLSAASDYTLTTSMRLLNSDGNYQRDNTDRTWIETIFVNGEQHATTGDVTFTRNNANESRTFDPFAGTAPLVLRIRMQRTDINGCFSGILSLTLTYVESNDYVVKIKGDSPEGYTVTAGDATAKNGQRLDPAKVPTGTDLRSVSIDAPVDKHVWGPVIDHAAKTVTFEVSEPVAPETGKWYKIQVLPTNGYVTTANTDNIVDALNNNIKTEGVKSNYMYLQNAPQPSQNNNYQSIHYFQGMPENEAAGYIYVTSFNGNNIMFQNINGRYIGNDGKQQMGVNNGSDVQLTLTNQGGFTNCYSWKHLRPWVLHSDDVAPYVGRASNSTNNFYSYFAEVDPSEKYDVYQVTVQGGDTNTTINYVGDSSASHGFNSIYNGGYLFFPKGHELTVDDFEVSDVVLSRRAIHIAGTGNVKTLTICERLNEVALRFVDAAGNTLKGAAVQYTPAEGGDVVTLNASMSRYDFGDVVYIANCFTAADGYTLGRVSYDVESATLTFTLSPHVLPTGVYRMVASKDDRGFFVDAENYVRVAKNRHKTGWAAPTVANSLWYVYNAGGNHYVISSLSNYASRGTDHVAFLKGTGDGSSFELDNPTTWLVDYKSTSSRYNTNYSGYDTTIPIPDYFTVKLSDTQLLKSTPGYDNAASCCLAGYEGGASDIEFQPYAESLITDPSQQALLDKIKALYATELLNGPVKLLFVDENGDPTTVSNVIYHPSDGSDDVELDATSTTYEFSNETYSDYIAATLFSISDNAYVLATSYNSGTNTLTFTITDDPNYLRFSPAPENGQWAEGTKWFTIRNVATQGYMDTAEAYIDEARNLKVSTSTTPTNRGGAWCVVSVGANSYNIYNAAYGPDFILGVVGSNGSARVQMYPKDNVPSGVNTAFDFTNNGNKLAGTNHAYGMHTAGGYLNRQNGYPALYSDNDGGSSFSFACINSGVVEDWPTYDVYKVEWGIRNKDVTSITYGGSGAFNKPTAPDGAYLLLSSGTTFTAENFTDNTSHAMANVSSREVSGHAYRLLVLDMKRPIRVTLPQTSYTMTMGASMEVPAYTVTDNAGESLLEGVTTTAHYTSDNASVVIDGISMRGVSAGSANISVTDFSFNALGTQYYYTDSSSFAGATATVTVTKGVMTVRFSEPSVMLVTKPDNTADVKQRGVVNFTGTDAITQLVIEPAAAATGATIETVTVSQDDKITIEGTGTNTVTLSSKTGVAADLTLTFTIASTGYNNQEATLKVRVLDNSDIVDAKEALTQMGNQPVGSGLGRYSYEGGNEAYNAAYAKFTNYCKDIYSQTDTEIANRCTAITNFTDGLNGKLSLNMPVAGKTLLRVRSSVEGKQNYVLSNATSGTPSMKNSKNGTSIWYLHTDGRLYGYESGQATEGSSVAAVAAGNVLTGDELTIGQAQDTLYSIKGSNYWTANDAGDALTVAGDASAAAARWILEDVTELPVTIGTTGYATLCSPVALTVPYGVEAYVDIRRDAPENNISVIKLQKLNGVIPANTAVVLKAAEAKTYNFRVTSSSDDAGIGTWENNVVMQGTYPKLAADTSKYTLQKKSEKINFYPNSSSAQLKPFRVFIPTPPRQSGQEVQNVQMFMMDFGGGLTTDLDTVLGTTSVGTTSPAFDLSGRLVQPTQRGLYLQQGRKVLRK